MADALISSVVKELINILKHQTQELKRTLGVEKEITNLSSKLQKITEVLDDAERRSFKASNTDIQLWIKDIKDFSYEVDDVLDEWRTRTLRQQIESSAPESSCSSFLPSCIQIKRFDVHRDIAKKIKELDSTLDRITKEKDQFKFNTCAASPSDQESKPVTTTFDVAVSEIQGRESDASTLISKLVENSGEEEERNGNGPPVISIVGTGGIGKTTLALLVFGAEQIKAHFEERMWICVSDPFDQIKIAKDIVQSTTKSSTDLSILQLLLEKIQSTLSGKRFLLVMDDVWTEEYAKWEPLKNSLKDGLPGSRILVTSRSERVATMMGSVYLHKLNLISDSEAWLLLSRIAFFGKKEEDCEKLNDIGQKIAEKCKGLPLAAKVMGGLLHLKNTTRDDWQNVLDNKIWELDEVVTGLFPHLYLSYNDLTPKMKQCFSYFAVFPKDYEIEVDELIRIWMAQGYVTMESEGRELFGGLAMRSLIQDFKKDCMDSNIIKSCKMHDIVHDFVQFLTRNECYNIDQHEDKAGIKNLRHLSWQNTGRNMNLAAICDIGKLRSLFAEGFSPDLFNGLKSVRVLRLRGCELQKLPKKIGNLLHLRYIDLSGMEVEELPDAVCSLYNLQTLDLKRCMKFSRLPDGIGNLRQLRYIDLSWSKVATLPDTICSLENLRTLVLKSCDQFSRLPDKIGDLRQLRYIDLSWSKVATLPDTICSLENLRTLVLEGCAQFSRLPDKIGDLSQLSYINLSNSKVEKLPDTICSLENLQTLVLKHCVLLSRLPERIGNLLNLRHLDIIGTMRLEMMPQGIAQLTQLCSLSAFKVGKESSKLGYMEKLTQLKGELSIYFLCDLNNAADVEEAEKAELRNKKHIKELGLDFSPGVHVGIDVMEALKPPPELQTLILFRYGGTNFPSWITLSLDNLRILQIGKCGNCSSLPPLGKLPSLETLLIDMKELRYVGSEFLGVAEVGGVAFPKLKVLQFGNCPEWEEWEDFKQEATIIIMPCIRELGLEDCRKLKTVPHYLLNRLESLNIKQCPGVSVGIDALKAPLELQTLTLNGYEGSHFPSWITLSLDNLRILIISKCGNCSSLPPLGKLPSLETLSISEMKELRYVGSEFLGVAEVGGVAFPKLKTLTFRNCPEWEEWEDFKEEATIIIMPCIRELDLNECSKLKTVPHHLLCRLESLSMDDCPGVSVGIDALKPPLELQTLVLNGYKGSHFPSWITLSLDNLRILQIMWCENCSSLPPLGKLPSLETLLIWKMKELRYVGSEFLGVAEVGGVAFPKLKELQFYHCSKWEEWEDFKQEATRIMIMPHIRELVLYDCEKLKRVPRHLLSRVESLKISGCPSLKVK